jgi:nicotinamide-nucleotide amidase
MDEQPRSPASAFALLLAIDPMDELFALAAQVGARLKQRGDTIAIAESSTGGLISAALLAVPGASAYFVGSSVVYTQTARGAFLDLPAVVMEGLRASTEAYALLLARTVQQRCATTWGLGESGASGPTGNRYGDAAGHCCFAIAGPLERARTLETASADRLPNMQAFAQAAIRLLLESLAA